MYLDIGFGVESGFDEGEKKHVSCVMGGNRDGHPPSSQDP